MGLGFIIALVVNGQQIAVPSVPFATYMECMNVVLVSPMPPNGYYTCVPAPVLVPR